MEDVNPYRMKPEETYDFQIKTTWQAIARMYNEMAARYQSTMATGFVLLNIDTESGTPSTLLGPKMGMEATSITRLLKSMEERGLIERLPNPVDRRSVLVFLTDFGKEKREDAKQAVLDFNHSIDEVLTQKEKSTFFEVIKKINEVITDKKSELQNL